MKKILIIFVLAFLILAPLGLAESTYQPSQQTNKIFLNPFYRDSMNANTNYTYQLRITPPDKVSSIASAIITFDAYISPTRIFNLWVNGQACNNPSYTISTTYASAGRSVFYFDCSNVITKEGTYTLTLRTTGGNIGASSTWADITYVNNPSGSAQVHGTEYTIGQTAKVWLQLLNANRSTINNGVCYTDIYSPSGAEYIERATMTNMNHDGIYYYDLPVPTTEGVYPVLALCYYEAGQTYTPLTSYRIINATATADPLSNTQTQDGNYFTITETPLSSGNPRRIDVEFNSTANICKNISESLLTGITISWVGRWNGQTNDDLTFQVFNHTSSSWISLTNTILATGTGTKTDTNSLQFNNITKYGLLNSAPNMRLRIIDKNVTDTTSTNFDTDYLQISCDQLSNPQWQEARGSSEIHANAPLNTTGLNITADLSGIGLQVWNYSGNRTLTETPLNYTLISENVWGYNGTISTNILSQIVNAVWNFAGTIYSGILNQFSGNVWNVTDRNLTYYPNFTQPDSINYSKIQEEVWNYTDGRYVHGIVIS